MSKIMMKIFALFAAIALFAPLGLFAQDQAGSAPDDYASALKGNPWAEKIRAEGVLRVGFDTFAPWAMPAKSGGYVGFEIQVAEALADDLGVKVKLVPTQWDGILQALLSNKFDILIGGMGITPERGAKVAFTDPYEYSGVGIAANKKLIPGLSKIEDFNKKDVTVAVKVGTTAASAARELLPQADILEFSDEGQIAQELKNGRAQVLMAGVPFPSELALDNPDDIYVPISGVLAKEPIGMALSPKNKDALPALNAWIKARRDAGWLDKTWAYWFETKDWVSQIK